MEQKSLVTNFLNRVQQEKQNIIMDCKVTSTCFWGNDAEEVLVHRFPLHKACRDGDPVTLSRLVAEVSYEQLLAEDEFYSWTPIHWAAYFGKVIFFGRTR